MTLSRIVFLMFLVYRLASGVAEAESLKVYPKATRVFEIIIRAVVGAMVVKILS